MLMHIADVLHTPLAGYTRSIIMIMLAGGALAASRSRAGVRNVRTTPRAHQHGQHCSNSTQISNSPIHKMLHLSSLKNLPKPRFRATRPFVLRTEIRNNLPLPRPAHGKQYHGVAPGISSSYGSISLTQHPHDPPVHDMVPKPGTKDPLRNEDTAKLSMDPPKWASSDPFSSQTQYPSRQATHNFGEANRGARLDQAYSYEMENSGDMMTPLHAVGNVAAGVLKTGASMVLAVGSMMSSAADAMSGQQHRSNFDSHNQNTHYQQNQSLGTSNTDSRNTRRIPINDTHSMSSTDIDLRYPLPSTPATASGVGDNVGHMYSPARYKHTLASNRTDKQLADETIGNSPSMSGMSSAAPSNLARGAKLDSPATGSIRSKLDEMDLRDAETPHTERSAARGAADILKDPSSILVSKDDLEGGAKADVHHVTAHHLSRGSLSKPNVSFASDEMDLSKAGTSNYKPGTTLQGLQGIDGGIAAAADTISNTGESMVSASLAEDRASPASKSRQNAITDIEEAPLPPPSGGGFSGGLKPSQPVRMRALPQYRGFHTTANSGMRIYSVSTWQHPTLTERSIQRTPGAVGSRFLGHSKDEARSEASEQHSRWVPGDNAAARTRTATYTTGEQPSFIQGVHDALHGEGLSTLKQAISGTVVGQTLTGTGDRALDHVEDPPLGRWDRRHFNLEQESRENPMLEDMMGGNDSEWRSMRSSAQQPTTRDRLEAQDSDEWKGDDVKPDFSGQSASATHSKERFEPLAGPRLEHIAGTSAHPATPARRFSTSSFSAGRSDPWPAGYLKTAVVRSKIGDLFPADDPTVWQKNADPRKVQRKLKTLVNSPMYRQDAVASIARESKRMQ